MDRRERESIMRQGATRPETPRDRRERAALEEDLHENPLAGRPLRRRLRNFRPDTTAQLTAIVNPEIVSRSEETETDDEGCLSLQGVLAPVERASSLRLEGLDRAGRQVGYDLEGAPARTAQHELDHLDGVLILDRTTSEARREALGTLRPRVVLR